MTGSGWGLTAAVAFGVAIVGVWILAGLAGSEVAAALLRWKLILPLGTLAVLA